ncbi:hypothetical protein [Mitsuokella sp. AF21-1AC]|uniref:hypothetical protein n=1 Tax=Mitsuokella sp. AF21-1AC TaxID=2292235 RepID=UPI000E497C0D|nr:hypothetical protein [Mitsuokella sp. AF21-1AC]RGS72029.1 hypothetical protein DWX75_07475 [Mitsuokella sp. AF21-1AC]
MRKKEEATMWGIIYDERIMGMDKEFGDHWEVVDVENEYDPVGRPDDIQSVINVLLEEDVIDRDDINSFDYYSDIDDFVDLLNNFVNGEYGVISYQVVYFCCKERIDKNFFGSRDECEEYIARNRYNYPGENVRPFKVIARDA